MYITGVCPMKCESMHELDKLSDTERDRIIRGLQARQVMVFASLLCPQSV
jgi:hypothetical protein